MTLIEPTGYSTDWGGPSAQHATPIPDYQPVRDARAAQRRAMVPGNPEATGPVLMEIVDMEQPPLRVFFGKSPNAMIHAEYAKRLAEWDAHQSLSEAAQ